MERRASPSAIRRAHFIIRQVQAEGARTSLCDGVGDRDGMDFIGVDGVTDGDECVHVGEFESSLLFVRIRSLRCSNSHAVLFTPRLGDTVPGDRPALDGRRTFPGAGGLPVVFSSGSREGTVAEELLSSEHVLFARNRRGGAQEPSRFSVFSGSSSST